MRKGEELDEEFKKEMDEIDKGIDSLPDAEEDEEDGIDDEFDEIDKEFDSLPDAEDVFHPGDGGMTQIDPPSLKLDAGPAEHQSIQW